MRTKVMTAAGISALLLSGCSQSAAAPHAVTPDNLPAYPAQESLLGTVTGTAGPSGSGIESGFGAHGEVVAAYLSCTSEGEVRIGILNSAPVAVPCGTLENPTRTVFDGLTAGAKLTATVEAVGDPVVVELVFTDAKR